MADIFKKDPRTERPAPTKILRGPQGPQGRPGVAGSGGGGGATLPINLATDVSGVLPEANQADQTMGGDCSGTTASCTVAKVKGTTITTAGGALPVGAVLRTTAAGTADWGAVDLADTDAVTGTLPAGNQAAQTMGGDCSGTTTSCTVNKVKGATVSTAGGALTTGNVLKVTGASTLDYGAVNLAGGAGHVTGTLPLANQAAPTGTGPVTVTSGAWDAAAGSTTGSGAYVRATSPTLVTPTLGAASATSLTLSTPLTVPNGGTGVGTLTSSEVVIGQGASALTTASNVKAGANFLSVGATVASAGSIRLTSAGSVLARNAGNSADLNLISASGSDAVNVGDDTNVSSVGLRATTSIGFVIGGTSLYDFTSSRARLYRLHLQDSDNTASYIFAPSNLAADRTITLPLMTGNDTLVLNDFAATLTNKTISLGSNTLTFTSAQLATACSDETGSGALCFATSPTFTTSIAIGSTVAGAGDIRLANNFTLQARNAANSANVQALSVDNANYVLIGKETNSGYILAGGGTSYIKSPTTVFQSDAGSAQATLTTSGLTVSGVLTVSGASASIGTNPATAGALALPNNTTVQFRNAANSGNVTAVTVDASDQPVFGGTITCGASATTVNGNLACGSSPATAGSFRIGNASGMYGRNAANSGNVKMIDVDASDRVVLGADYLRVEATKTTCMTGLVCTTTSMGALDIDWSKGNVFTKSLLNSGGNTITFSNTTDGQTITVVLTSHSGGSTVTWPTVKWTGGAAPTMSTPSKTDVYTFVKAGSTIYGSYVQNMS